MSTLAPLLQAFFTERLIGQRDASPHTIASYRDTVCLLLRFAQQRTGKAPHHLSPLTSIVSSKACVSLPTSDICSALLSLCALYCLLECAFRQDAGDVNLIIR